VIFRREPLHRKLARKAHLQEQLAADAESMRLDPATVGVWGPTGVHGLPRPRRWDAVATAEAPGLTGDELEFITLPNGELVAETEEPEDSLAPLAEAIEQAIERPYRAEAVRRTDDVWAVAVRRIEVAEFEADGDEIELVVSGGERSLVVDGERVFGSIPQLERIGARDGDAYVVRARRVDADFWEVETQPL
jgi:hypothetical protein